MGRTVYFTYMKTISKNAKCGEIYQSHGSYGSYFEEEILINKYLTNQEVRPYAKFVRC